MSLPPPSSFGAPARFSSWRKSQDEAFLEAMGSRKRFVVLALPTGCLAGDTIIHVHRAGKSMRMTLEQAYRLEHGTRKNPKILSFTRSFNGSKIGLHRYDSVEFRGIRSTWRLTLVDGRTLRGTPDHRILTPSGFVALADLEPGVSVICDTPRPEKGSRKPPKVQYLRTQGLVYHPYAGNVKNKTEGRIFAVPTHRLVAEAHINGLSTEEFIAICRTEEATARALVFLDPVFLAVHHKNSGSKDNRIENLEILSHAAHGKHHGHVDHFHQGIPALAEVRKVEPTGKRERVFDVLACEPHENFTANGIVAHNSGKTVVAATYQLFDGGGTYLTATRGQQDQVHNEWRESGYLDVRGMSNYGCLESPQKIGRDGQPYSTWNCDQGKCMKGEPCWRRAGGCLYFDAVAAAAKVSSSEGAVVTNYSFWLTDGGREEGPRLDSRPAVLVCDECLPPSTLIGGVRIVDLQVGDLIPSFDPATGKLQKKKVLGRTVSKATKLFHLSYAGRSIVCTGTHRVLTPDGWVQAKDLHPGDLVLYTDYEEAATRPADCSLPLVQGTDNPACRKSPTLQLPEDRKGLLLFGMWKGIHGEGGQPEAREREGTEAFKAEDAQQQPDVDAWCQGENANNAAGHGMEAPSPGREWARPHNARTLAGVRSRVEHRSRSFHSTQGRRTQASDPFQAGRGRASLESSDRDRRGIPFGNRTTGSGCQKRERLDVTRLDSIEVLEPGSDGTFGGLCPGGLVFNLEVEDSRAYVAQGLAVHNSHLIGGELERHLEVTIRDGECKWPRDAESNALKDVEIGQWSRWAAEKAEAVGREIADGRVSGAEVVALRSLARRLGTISGIVDEGTEPKKWVVKAAEIDRRSRGVGIGGRPGVTFVPVWPESHSSKVWRDAAKVLLVSATIRPSQVEQLGIGPGEYDFLEYPSPLPMHRRPIYHLDWKAQGKATALRYDSSEQVLKAWMEKNDAIIDVWGKEHKGIIHSQSYPRAKEIKSRSRHGDWMLIHDSWNAREVVKQFREAKPPCILVSPSVTTGYDFPFDAARWQIIAKVPFAPGIDPVVAERSRQQKGYVNELALREIVQRAGRVMRAEDDYGVTFVTDDQVGWLVWKHGKEALPGWFRSAYKRVGQVPKIGSRKL